MSRHADAIRVPPHNDEAERSMIGAALIDNRVVKQLRALVAPDALYRESHRHIWRAIDLMDTRGDAIDVITLSDQLNAEGLLEAVGGPNVIARLSSEVPSAANCMYYAQIVARKAQLRAHISATLASVDEAYEELDGDDHDAWCARTASRLTSLLTGHHVGTALPSEDFTKEFAAYLYDGVDLGPRWDTPFQTFNNMIGGRFEAGQLIVVGARPGGGKTAWAMQVALHNAAAGHNSVFFSMEMTRVQLSLRMVACRAGVDASAIKARAISEHQWRAVGDALVEVREAAIWVDERPGLTLAQIEGECVRLASTGHPPAVVVVDYLQLVRPADLRANKSDQLDLIAQGLHEMAMRQRCVVIALAQLNRASGASDGSPGQGSFKGSGGIEAAADVALVLWRDDEDEPRQGAPPRMERAGVVPVRAAIVKNRSGATGPIEYMFHGAQYRFEDINAEDDR
jgi:replicative DNA helicase